MNIWNSRFDSPSVDRYSRVTFVLISKSLRYLYKRFDLFDTFSNFIIVILFSSVIVFKTFARLRKIIFSKISFLQSLKIKTDRFDV